MGSSLRWIAAASTAVAVLAPAAAQADSWSTALGARARSIAMGGARIAVDDRAEDALYNPAMLADMRGFTFDMPELSVDGLSGPSLSDVSGKLNTIAKTNASSNDYHALAQLFANRPSQSDGSFGFQAGLGYSNFHLSFIEELGLIGNQGPNTAALGNPAILNGHPFNSKPLPAGSPLSYDYLIHDGYASGPVLSYGTRVPNPIKALGFGPLRVGANVWLATGRTDIRDLPIERDANQNITAVDAEQRTSGPTQTGVGVDVGVLMGLPHHITGGLAIKNLVSPGIQGIEEQPIVTAGASCRLSRKCLLAADLENITSSNGNSVNIRAGAEYYVIPKIALRAGASNNGVAVGFGVFGVDFAYSFGEQLITADVLHF